MGGQVKYLASLPTDNLLTLALNLKAQQLLDSWLDTYGDEQGVALPSLAEEELLAELDRTYGTRHLEEAQSYYATEMGGQA